MQFGNKSNNRFDEESAQKHGILGMFKNSELLKAAWKKANEDQLFFNARLRIFELLSTITDAQTAIVDLHINKRIMTYEMSFDMYYTKPDGRVMTNKGFHSVSLTKEGCIPFYILDEVKKAGKADVRFDTEDIETLYNERAVKVNESLSYTELLDECKNSGITTILFKDRVFYTHIECYNNGTLVDAIHAAVLKELPDNIKKALYPCDSYELVL